MLDLTPARKGLMNSAARLVQDESGSATAWNLVWLTGFAVIAGVAVDSTNARRVQTMMASTADAAALAGLMELPAPNFGLPYAHGTYGPTVEAAALNYAAKNMSTARHGAYIQNDDIYVGHWDFDTRTFEWGGEPVNAVRVHAGRTAEKNNGLSTSLLRLIGFDQWEINTVATAAMPLAECYGNGIVAAGTVRINSNAEIFSGCLHGENGVRLQNNITWWEGTGVSAGMDSPIMVAPNQFDPYGAPVEPNTRNRPLMPSDMAFDVVGVGRALLDLNNNFAAAYHPDYQYMRVEELQDPTEKVIVMTKFAIGDTLPITTQAMIDAGTDYASLGPVSGIAGMIGAGAVTSVPGYGKFKLGDMVGLFDLSIGTTANLIENRTYYAPCTQKLTIDGTIKNVVIVSECRVEVQADAVLENVLLVSLDDKPPSSMSAGQGVRFGANDGCRPGGGVRLWANGDFSTASGTSWQGAQVYVDGDFTLAGQTGANYGISAHVTGDVHIAANAQIAGLADDATFIDEEAGGAACVGGVDFDWITNDHLWVLVE